MSIGSISSGSSLYGANSILRQNKAIEEEEAKAFEKNDADKSGGLNKDEFYKMNTSLDKSGLASGENLEKIKDAIFSMFDTDSDGEVSAEEIAAGRESMLSKLDSQYGNLDTMSQVNNILNQTQSTLMDMMGGSSSDDEDNTFNFLTNNYNAKIQQYLDQAARGKDSEYSVDAIDTLLNSGSISKLI